MISQHIYRERETTVLWDHGTMGPRPSRIWIESNPKNVYSSEPAASTPGLALGPLLLAGLAASHGRFHLGLLGLLHLGITKGITIKALHEHSLLHSL